MSKAPDASGEGVSRWKQRQAAKAMMYAMSNERSGDAIAARRQLATADKYAPQVQGWQGVYSSGDDGDNEDRGTASI